MHRLASLIITALLVAAAWAGDAKVEAYKFRFEGPSGPVEIELNSKTMGFGLHDLAPGDVRTTVAEDGSSITISRLEDSYSLALDGEVFEIPARHAPPPRGHHRKMMMMHDGMGGHGMKAHRRGLDEDGLLIISADPLDESTQVTIRDALSAAGVTRPVNFLSPGTPGENVSIDEHVDADGARVIIKRVIEE